MVHVQPHRLFGRTGQNLTIKVPIGFDEATTAAAHAKYVARVPGFEVQAPYRKMGWHASDTHGLSFHDCRVPEDHLLGERGNGFRQFLAILDEMERQLFADDPRLARAFAPKPTPRRSGSTSKRSLACATGRAGHRARSRDIEGRQHYW